MADLTQSEFWQIKNRQSLEDFKMLLNLLERDEEIVLVDDPEPAEDPEDEESEEEEDEDLDVPGLSVEGVSIDALADAELGNAPAEAPAGEELLQPGEEGFAEAAAEADAPAEPEAQAEGDAPAEAEQS